MICHRCHRPITSPTWINNHPYGSDCARHLTGLATKPSARKNHNAHAEENQDQFDLFSESKRPWTRWTAQEDELIRKHYPNIDLPGRTWSDISRRASRLGATTHPDDPGAAPFVHRWVRELVPDAPRTARSVFDLAR